MVSGSKALRMDEVFISMQPLESYIQDSGIKERKTDRDI